MKLKSALLSLARAAVIYGWLWEDNKYIGNAFMFYSWIVLTLTILALVNDADVPRPEPVWFSRAFAFVEVSMIAAFGHFIIATVVLVSYFFAEAVIANTEKRKTEKTNA